MRTWVIIIIAVAMASFLLLRSESHHDDPVASRSQSADPAQSGPRDEPIRQNPAPTNDAPRLASRPGKVVIDTSPRRPGEMLVTYKHRVDLARRFDEFVRRSGVTDEQARALLIAMYDYQQNGEALQVELRRDHTIPTEDWRPLVRASVNDLLAVFEATLTREQYEAWWEICSVLCFGYLNGPVLRLEGER